MNTKMTGEDTASPLSIHRSSYIEGRWRPGSGYPLISTNPATGEEIWKGSSASPKEVDQAATAARAAAPDWAGLGISKRIQILQEFAKQLQIYKQDLATAISMETGKPLWEAETEVLSMAGKVPISIEAEKKRCGEIREENKGTLLITRHKPHGVVAVFGPFNFPGHLPNGHIIPALLAGNTVVFKPSELTPLVAERMIELWIRAGLPPGVLNLVQGGRDTGQALAAHPQIDGIYFTGSAKTGESLLKQFGAQPQKILALEMGGNNPLIVTQVSDFKAAAYITIASAFLTSGQRCTCARRVIVPLGKTGDAFLQTLVQMVNKIQVGRYDSQPQPFMGPVISGAVAKQLLTTQELLLRDGGVSLVAMTPMDLGEAFLRPGILDVTQVGGRSDEELFGPLLQVIRVSSFQEALNVANQTRYGLSAGLLSDNREEFDEFYRVIRAGIVNWNLPTTGASSSMPFGGVGVSGNHRPSAFYAADYCAYPVASMEKAKIAFPDSVFPGISL